MAILEDEIDHSKSDKMNKQTNSPELDYTNLKESKTNVKSSDNQLSDNTDLNNSHKMIKSRSTITKIKIGQARSKNCNSPPWTTTKPGEWECEPKTPPHLQCTLKCRDFDN